MTNPLLAPRLTPSMLSLVAMYAERISLYPADRDSLSLMMNSVNRLGHCVINLLDMAEIERGQLNYDPRPTRLTELVEDTVSFFLPKAEEARIALSSAVEPGITVNADHDLVVHVLTNIISNALKFTPHGGTIRVELKSVPQGAECAVTDSGMGISASDLARIFTPLERGRSRGVGQGLVIAKSIVDMHGGRIGAESELGRPLSRPAQQVTPERTLETRPGRFLQAHGSEHSVKG